MMLDNSTEEQLRAAIPMSSNREGEASSSHRWFGGLKSWFRNLSGPKKAVATAVTVAGGVGAILGAINGAITLVETVNQGSGAENLSEGVENTNEGAGTLSITSGKPIRADYSYNSGPLDGVMPIGLNADTDPSEYLPLYPSDAQLVKKEVAESDPFVWIIVTSQVKDETISLPPYLVIEVTKVTPMPETVNYAVYAPGGGGGGEIRYFVATLSPNRKGVFYAPQRTADTSLGPGSYTPPPALRRTYPYFTLTPDGESEVFQLDFSMLPGYYYYFHVGVQYSYKGHQGVVWSQEFVAGVPLEAEVWWQPNAQGTPFEKYGDLQSWEEYLEGLNDPLAKPLPRHDQREIEKAIEAQEEAIQKYSYPYTPPEQLDTPKEG